MKQMGHYCAAHALSDQEFEGLSVDSWGPADGAGAIYAFDWLAGPLRPFYEQLVGSDRVHAFGRAFTVSLEEGQWSWIKKHGWAYEAHCGTAVQRAVVPVLYHQLFGFAQLPCGSNARAAEQTCHFQNFFGFAQQQCNVPITHVWRGRWKGPAAHLRLYFSGEATVETTRGLSITRRGGEVSLDFSVDPDDVLRVTLMTPPMESPPAAWVMEITGMTERVPVWELVEPIVDGDDGDAVAGALPPAGGPAP